MKKWIFMFTIAALVSTMIAGCGKYETEAPKKEATAEQGGQDEKVTLNLLQFKVEITDKVKQMAADYTKENPNVVIEADVSKDYQTLLKTRFASGEGPDIFFAKSFTDMNDWHERLVDLSNEPWMSQVSDSAVPGMTIDGKKYGFPVAFEGYGFIYNKDLFAKAGIDKVPTTLTELKQVNDKLKAAGITSYSEGYKEPWILGQHLFSLPFAYDQDPEGLANMLNEGSAKVKDIPFMNGFFDVLDMTVNYGKGAESIGVSYDNQVADFASGKSAMMQQGVWTFDSIMKINPNINMGMFAIPLSDNVNETKLPVGVPAYYVINKDSKNVEEAKKFLIWLHKNGQKYLVDSFHLIPAFNDLKATDDLGPLAADLNQYVEKNQTIPWAFLLFPTSTIRDKFAQSMQAYIAGQKTKDQVLDDVQEFWSAAVKK